MAAPTTARPQARRRRDTAIVAGLCAVVTALVVGWFATGHASAPDDGLHQIDILMLDEQVPGIDAVDGRPTMVVARGVCPGTPPEGSHLDERFRLVVSSDPETARRLALHAAAVRCQPGYALLAGDGTVRYRSYDPDWPQHAFEQEVLLDAIEHGHGS